MIIFSRIWSQSTGFVRSEARFSRSTHLKFALLLPKPTAICRHRDQHAHREKSPCLPPPSHPQGALADGN